METQTLTLRPGDPLFISTPFGLLTIERVKGNNRKLRFSLPPGFTAFVGEKPELKESKFVDENGKVKPEFVGKVLLVDSEGKLMDVVAPRSLRLVEEIENDDFSRVRSEVI